MQFDKILFTSACLAMACDGEIHGDEIAEIKALAQNTPYFGDLDWEEELKHLIIKIKSDHTKFIGELLDSYKEMQFSKVQKYLLMEVLLKVIYADKNIDENEVGFFHEVKRCLDLKDQELLSKYPSYVEVIMPKITGQQKNTTAVSFSLKGFEKFIGEDPNIVIP